MDYILEICDYNIVDKTSKQQLNYKRQELDEIVLAKIPNWVLNEKIVRELARYLLTNSLDWIITRSPKKEYFGYIIDGLAIKNPYPYTDKYNKIRLTVLEKYRDMFKYSNKLWFISEEIDDWVIRNAEKKYYPHLLLACCKHGDERIASRLTLEPNYEICDYELKNILRYLLVRKNVNMINIFFDRYKPAFISVIIKSDADTIRWALKESIITEKDVIDHIVNPWNYTTFNPYNIIKETYQEIDYIPISTYIAANAIITLNIECIDFVSKIYGLDFMDKNMLLCEALYRSIRSHFMNAEYKLTRVMEYLEEYSLGSDLFLYRWFIVTKNNDIQLPNLYNIGTYEMYTIYSFRKLNISEIDTIVPQIEKHHQKTRKKSAYK